MEDIETRPRAKRRWFRPRLFLAVLTVVLVAGAFIMGAVWGHQEIAPVVTSDLISQRLVDVRELATLEYYYTNMGRFEHQVDFYGWKVPLTRKRFIVSYDGIIKAGIDLSGMTVQISGNTITITLPKAKILSHEMPEDSLQIFDETRNLLNPIEISDYTGFTRDQKVAMETRSIENGLLTRAAEKARTIVRELLSLMPGVDAYELKIN